MGVPRRLTAAAACAAAALLGACSATTAADPPRVSPSASSSASGSASVSASASPSVVATPTPVQVTGEGARAADIPDTAIMAQLARRAERIARHLPPPTPPADVDRGSNRALGYQLMVEFGFPSDQWPYLDALWTRESGWNQLAENPTSGAYGIPQSLPATKMGVVGADWRTNPETQIRWGLAYIGARYGSAQKAWQHSQQFGWY